MGDRVHLRSTLLTMVLGVLSLLPHGLLGNPAEEAGRAPRVKRGWVWNQFFVLEEYTGLEPLYIGKVSTARYTSKQHEKNSTLIPEGDRQRHSITDLHGYQM